MYLPRTPPSDPKDLPQWLVDELRRISQSMEAGADVVRYRTLYAPPEKFGEGDTVLADGVTWNPGSGPGWYGYRAGAWRFLG
jgi:hypothetical protein